MLYQIISSQLLWLLLAMQSAAIAYYDYKKTEECKETDKKCHFILIVEYKVTMLYQDGLVKSHGGKLYRVEDKNFSSPVDQDKVIQGDGYYQNTRLAIVANNSLPGPAIEVFEGQDVSVEVRNDLLSEGVTIHWHGIKQSKSNTMDGVAFITQCPIVPGSSFTYRFNVERDIGTHFYHAHIGAMRTQGLFGPLIVRKRSRDLGVYDRLREYTMVLNDWNHNHDSNMNYVKDKYSQFYDAKGNEIPNSKDISNSVNVGMELHSVLLNGKGRYYDPVSHQHNDAPLTVFKVKSGESVRFRVIAAGNVFYLRLSIDQHELTVIATDGQRVEDYTVNSIIIFPGERYDFVVTANQSAGSYWIYAETSEFAERGEAITHRAEAILEYEENPMPDTNYDEHVTPWSNRTRCTEKTPCYTLNCPFPASIQFGEHQYCRYVTNLTAVDDSPFPSDSDFEEKFYNFAFASKSGPSINGRHWVHPQFSSITEAETLQSGDFRCDQCGPNQTCSCTHSTVLEHQKLYQLILSSVGEGTGDHHPIHIHGRHFQVVKIGFLEVDNITGKYPDPPLISKDIECEGITCHSAKWANQSWCGPGINDDVVRQPVLKDTVVVPNGGYAVVRFRADNPGLWMLHCHTQVHNTAGMALLLNEASNEQKIAATSFPACQHTPDKNGLALPKCSTCSITASSPLHTETLTELEKGLVAALILSLLGVMSVVSLLIRGKFKNSRKNQLHVEKPNNRNSGQKESDTFL